MRFAASRRSWSARLGCLTLGGLPGARARRIRGGLGLRRGGALFLLGRLFGEVGRDGLPPCGKVALGVEVAQLAARPLADVLHIHRQGVVVSRVRDDLGVLAGEGLDLVLGLLQAKPLLLHGPIRDVLDGPADLALFGASAGALHRAQQPADGRLRRLDGRCGDLAVGNWSERADKAAQRLGARKRRRVLIGVLGRPADRGHELVADERHDGAIDPAHRLALEARVGQRVLERLPHRGERIRGEALAGSDPNLGDLVAGVVQGAIKATRPGLHSVQDGQHLGNDSVLALELALVAGDLRLGGDRARCGLGGRELHVVVAAASAGHEGRRVGFEAREISVRQRDRALRRRRSSSSSGPGWRRGAGVRLEARNQIWRQRFH